jgi:type IV secretory pathway TrbD component
MADVGAAASSADYYYIVRARDRAGNVAYSRLVGKLGASLGASWNLLASPFLTHAKPVSEELAGLNWTAARTWDPDRLPNHWTVNRPGRNPSLNSLQNLSAFAGFWVETSSVDVYSSCGIVANCSFLLKAGWNLVAYPYHETLSASEALFGLPWDSAAAYNIAAPALITNLQDWYPIFPGDGLWVHLTSDAVWNAANIP